MAFKNLQEPSFEMETSSNCALHPKPVMENIIYKLKARETHLRMTPAAGWHQQRTFYRSVFPNLTVVNADKPLGLLKKFSPDGKLLIAFSPDMNFVEVYEYQGCQAGENLLSNANTNVLHEGLGGNISKAYELAKEKLFSKFFRLKHRVATTSGNHILNKEFCLFTDDSRYLLVVSFAMLQNQDYLNGMDSFVNNESLTPISPYEDYTLYCIDMIDGVKTSSIPFKSDRILASSRNQGIFLLKNVLAVLSIQQQVIHIFKILEGRLIQTHKIGRFAFTGDEFQYSQVFPNEAAYRDQAYCTLKNKLLIALHQKAVESGPGGISRFFRHFEFFEKLKMWKLQLIDERTLLVKYAYHSVVQMMRNISEPSTLPSFFLFYDFESGQVLSVHENTSEKLLDIFQSHPGLFYQAEVYRGNLQAACYDIYSYKILQRLKETIINAKYGGEMEARKRILGQLPMQPQILNPSPYLDLSLFSYDDKYISAVERPKTCGDHPIRFYSRKSGLLRFEMMAGIGPAGPNSGRRLTVFIFHPTEPFAISMKRNQDNHVINFHLRHLPDCS